MRPARRTGHGVEVAAPRAGRVGRGRAQHDERILLGQFGHALPNVTAGPEVPHEAPSTTAPTDIFRRTSLHGFCSRTIISDVKEDGTNQPRGDAQRTYAAVARDNYDRELRSVIGLHLFVPRATTSGSSGHPLPSQPQRICASLTPSGPVAPRNPLCPNGVHASRLSHAACQYTLRERVRRARHTPPVAIYRSATPQFKLLDVPRKRSPVTKWVRYALVVLGIAAIAAGIWWAMTVGPWHQLGTGAFKDISGGIQSLVTATGVVVGGSWAYFKFVRGRTYRPRLSVELACQWRKVDETDLLHVRVRVTNIGASMITLNQHGTGLQVAFRDDSVHNEIKWKSVQLTIDDQSTSKGVDRTFEILREHAWIEPGETVSEDLLLDPGGPPSICRLEVRLLWSLKDDHSGKFSGDDVEVFARRIVAPEELLIDKMAGGKAT